MQGFALCFYMHENQKHHGELLYEWLLEQARSSKLRGGSVFKAIAGYGRNGVMHEQHFFELAGDMTVLVEFILEESDTKTLLDIVHEDKAPLFWTRHAVEFGIVGQS